MVMAEIAWASSAVSSICLSWMVSVAMDTNSLMRQGIGEVVPDMTSMVMVQMILFADENTFWLFDGSIGSALSQLDTPQEPYLSTLSWPT